MPNTETQPELALESHQSSPPPLILTGDGGVVDHTEAPEHDDQLNLQFEDTDSLPLFS